MELDLGGKETIADPSPEVVRHHLRYVRAESPFVVLQDSSKLFIQAIFNRGNDKYRVEYKMEGRQFFTHVDYETACDLFLFFLEGGVGLNELARWKRFRVMNPHIENTLAWSLLFLIVVGVFIGIMLYLLAPP